MIEAVAVSWTEQGEDHRAHWVSEAGAPAPRRLVVADDRTKADEAYGLAGQGVALLWRGDFHNARQLLTAMASRIDRHGRRARRGAGAPQASPAQMFHLHRQAQAQRARTLGALLIPLEAD